MWSEKRSAVQEDRTFIETARRAQIVSAAIQTIAELGYGQASMARIAQRAGISKGVIAYHFAGKDDLIRELVTQVVTEAESYMRPRISAESTGSGMLRVYIESNLAFMREHREHLIAIVEIARNARRADGAPRVDVSALSGAAAGLGQLLATFQSAGEYRAGFDPQVMALAIRAAIDAVPARLAADPELDLDHYGLELATLFDLATRAQEPRPGAAG